MDRTAIIVWASSGIGAALARDLAGAGYKLGIAARRLPQLEALAAQLPTPAVVGRIDVSDVDGAMAGFNELVEQLGGVELVVISAGTGHENPDLRWEPERDTIAVNVAGFAAVATAAMAHFTARGGGHLVAISSVAAVKGDGEAPAYGASKAFVSRYLQALRHRAAKHKLGVYVTDVKAGFVDTAMAKGEGLFWVAPVGVASAQIMAAIRRRRSNVYVTRRWGVVARLLAIMPEWLYNRL